MSQSGKAVMPAEGGRLSIATRSFSAADQLQFATISGDQNPMHMDSLQARRTQAGAPVVHGIHLLLWALDSVAEARPDLPPFRGLRAFFQKFVYLDERVHLEFAQQQPTSGKLELFVNGGVRSKISFTLGDAVEDSPAWTSFPLDSVPASRVPLNPYFEDISNRSGRLEFQLSAEDAIRHFPAATKWIGAKRVSAIAATTYLVGMVCPGLHSIYSELSVRSCAPGGLDDSLAFRVTQADPRFRSVDMEIAGGGLVGTAYSTARTPPTGQASMREIAGLVGPAEFQGTTALVIGGSRGLGELTAKLIATGGGRVIITWRVGKDDAERVVSEIRSTGGACEAIPYDVREPSTEQLRSLVDTPTHAYYFATPAIFRHQSAMYEADRFREFLEVYVDGFWRLCQTLRTRQPRLSILYPSSVSVTERPEGMTEYTMAKAAGEVLSADINALLAPMHVTVSRLPRLPTDQTASVVAAHTESPTEVLLPIIRQVQAWPALLPTPQ